MAQTLWYFVLLGRFRAESHARSVERFRTQKTASLLGYLVLHADRPHTREALIDQFWPESTFEAGQTNLRVALNSLRKQLEPPEVPAGSLLIATRDTVQIVSAAIETDVAQFETAIRRGQNATDASDQMEHWSEAIRLYRGRLLPTLYDDWVLREQQHLETLYLTALRKMITLCDRKGDVGTALEFALRAVDTDPLNEDLHAEVLRLYIVAEQPSAAVRHFQQLETMLSDQIDGSPSQTTRALIEPWIGSKTLLTQRALRKAPGTDVPSPEAPTAEPFRALLNPALPPRLGSLYGREEECDRLLETLRSDRATLLTLTGPGGVGKTRLAMELAHRMAEELGNRLAFVSLAEFTEAEMISFAIMQAFQLHLTKQIEPVQALAEHLQGAPALLVLDNFEQLVPSGIDEVRALRDRIPNLKLLITSRQVLGLDGEQTFTVLPLPVPTSTSRTGASLSRKPLEATYEALLQNSSVQLFIARAQGLRPDFQITPRNAQDLAEICSHLEGMPLAIELAASWVNVLTPSQILERFQFPARTLASRRRDISPRHRTVQNTIAWSYDLLSPALQQALCVLSTFRGGWTLEALEATAAPSENQAETVRNNRPSADALVEVLAELQERSLIFARDENIQGEFRMRYRMLESVRDFCSDRVSSEEMQADRRRHADYFLEYARLARQDYDTERQPHAIARLYADYENVLAAMEWFLNAPPDAPHHGLQIAADLYGMWYLRGMHAEGRHYLERALAHPCNQASIAPRATALNMLAKLYAEFGDNESALKLMYQGLAIRQGIGRDGIIGTSMNSIGIVLQAMGRLDEALDAYRQAVDLFRKDGRPTHVAIGLRNMGIVCDLQRHTVEADRYIEESLEICRRENYTHGLYSALGTLANRDYLAGRHVQARERYEECVAFFRESQNVSSLASMLSSLGRLCHDIGERPTAIQYLSESLTLFHRMDDRPEIILLFEHIAYIHRDYHPRIAAKCCGAAQAGRTAIAIAKPVNDLAGYTTFMDVLRTRLGDQDFHVTFESGLHLKPDAAIDFAFEALSLP